MLSDGTGIINLFVGFPANTAKYWYNGSLEELAPALATASETAKIAFAPNFYLHHPHSF